MGKCYVSSLISMREILKILRVEYKILNKSHELDYRKHAICPIYLYFFQIWALCFKKIVYWTPHKWHILSQKYG